MVKIIMSVIKRGMPDSRDISEIELLGFGNMMTRSFLSRVTRLTIVKHLARLKGQLRTPENQKQQGLETQRFTSLK